MPPACAPSPAKANRQSLGLAFCVSEDGLRTVRIVRTGVEAVRDAVAVTVAAAPAATLKLPAVVALAPFRTVVGIALADFLIVALDPHVAMAVPVPVAGRPFVAAACMRHDFVARRRRCGTDDTTSPFAKACAGTKAAVLIRAAAAAQRIRFMMLLLSVGVRPL